MSQVRESQTGRRFQRFLKLHHSSVGELPSDEYPEIATKNPNRHRLPYGRGSVTVFPSRERKATGGWITSCILALGRLRHYLFHVLEELFGLDRF